MVPRQESGRSLPDARASAARSATAAKRVVKMGHDRLSAAAIKGNIKKGPDRRNAAIKKGNIKKGPDRRRAIATTANKASLESDYTRGIRTPAQIETCRKASALPSVFMPAHKVLLSPHSN
jgi:hypothetical protein